jgi:hypothetical protein
MSCYRGGSCSGQTNEKFYTNFKRTIVTHVEGMRVGILFYHCRMCLVMVVYELMFQKAIHRYLKTDYDLFHVPNLFVILKKQLKNRAEILEPKELITKGCH